MKYEQSTYLQGKSDGAAAERRRIRRALRTVKRQPMKSESDGAE